MPISVTCLACHKTFKAKDSLAGRSGPCPSCGQTLTVPKPEEAAADFLLQDSPVPEPSPATEPEDAGNPLAERPAAPVRPPKRRKPVASDVASLPPITSGDPPAWLRQLHWLLALALIPLALSLLQSESAERDTLVRLLQTLDDAPLEVRNKAERVLDGLSEGKGSLDDLFALLPGQRLSGAFLARNSYWHWAFAAGASLLFLAFFVFLASDDLSEVRYVLGAALFTATVGILFLLVVQFIATASRGVWVTGGGIVMVIFYLVKLIGFSYDAALNPENGFFLSVLGFTLGVGFCEEVCKALPVFLFSRRSANITWRSLFLWGLASGAGFGIAEGLMYSSNFYNGIMGPGAYVVRFISCVALHAVWTGSVAVTFYQQRGLFDQVDHFLGYIPPLFVIVGVPMILHGLYDTLLKKDMNALALVVAVLSFLYLAFQISRRNVVDDKARTKAMLREYQRRREAMR